jgi:Ion channel regulatory protein UNC-93
MLLCNTIQSSAEIGSRKPNSTLFQGNFLALNSDDATMSRHSGLFWAMMISSHFFGNIFAYTLFRDLEDIDGHTRNLVGSVLLSVTGMFGILIGT